MRRTLFLLLGLTAIVSLAISSGGFTSVSADRTTEVAVVNDDNAYLGVADELQCGAGSGTGENGGAVVNRFPETELDAITVVAAIPDDETGELRIGSVGRTEQIGPGDSAEFELDGPFRSGESATVQVKPPTGNVSAADTLVLDQVRASGSGVSVLVHDRAVSVDCPAGTSNSGGDDNGEKSNSGEVCDDDDISDNDDNNGQESNGDSDCDDDDNDGGDDDDDKNGDGDCDDDDTGDNDANDGKESNGDSDCDDDDD